MDYTELRTSERTVGTRETLRALEKSQCKMVFFAKDANPEILKEVVDLCKKNKIPIAYVETMKLLGEYCGIKVPAAVASLL